MEILCHPSIWKLYFDKNSSNTLSVNETLLINVIKNNNNKYTLNETIINFSCEYFNSFDSDKIDYNDAFGLLLLDLNNNDRTNSCEIEKEIECDSDLVDFFSKNKTINFLLSKEQLSIPVHQNHSVSIFDNVQKPNKDWLYLSLLAFNGVSSFTLYNYDFGNNDEISNLISNITTIKNAKEQKVYIQSDYMNFGFLFNKISKNKIVYCTSYYEYGRSLKTTAKLHQDVRRVKDFFGTNSTFLVSKNKKCLHPRTLLYNNIVVHMDNDFDQININNSNWNLTIILCSNTFTKRIDNLNTYRPIQNYANPKKRKY